MSIELIVFAQRSFQKLTKIVFQFPALSNFNQTDMHRQARFGYFPLLGLLLANLLSDTTFAKYAPLGSLRLSYDPIPRVKPLYTQAVQSSYWTPIQHANEPQRVPLYSGESGEQHYHHHHHIPPSSVSQHQIVNIRDRPTQIVIEDSSEQNTEPNAGNTVQSLIAEGTDNFPSLTTNIEKPDGEPEEPLPVESRTLSPQLIEIIQNGTHLPTKSLVKRGTQYRYKVRKNNKYMNQYQKRRRYPTTTTPDYYEDTYEDITTRRSKPRRQPTRPRRPVSYESYEYQDSINYSDRASGEYEYESYDFTTRSPYKKRRRTTTTTMTSRPKRVKTKNRNKNRKRQKITTEEYEDDEYENEYLEPITEIEIKQRQQPGAPNAPPQTQILNGTTTTEPSTTSTTVSTVGETGGMNMTNNTSTNTTGYGNYS